ncbi:hypothetical protein X975_23648, partial [Stegodyphus mimosarum]
MQPVVEQNDKPPQLDLQHLPAEVQEKLQSLGRAEEFKMSDIQKLIWEATGNIEMAQRKQKLYYEQKRRGGLKRKKSENTSSAINKRPKHNGQGQPKVAKRTAKTSERSLRSKQPRLQPEDQCPEYSRSQEQRRTRAQEQGPSRTNVERITFLKYPSMERRSYKRKRKEQQAGNGQQQKSRKLAQATIYPTFKDWAKKRMADCNKISSISYSNV